MQTLENDPAAVARVVADSDAPKASYEAARFNAIKYDILSRLAVLAHEDSGKFTDLLAEGARINDELKSTLSSPRYVMPSAAPFQRGLSGENTSLRDLFDTTPVDNAGSMKSAELDLVAGQKAAAILRKGGANAYEKARQALIPETRDWWDERVADEEYPATAEGLAEFIHDSLKPSCYRMVKEAQFTSAIKAQILGEGPQVYRLENLNHYETHPDRKFERTFAMLLKLKIASWQLICNIANGHKASQAVTFSLNENNIVVLPDDFCKSWREKKWVDGEAGVDKAAKTPAAVVT